MKKVLMFICGVLIPIIIHATDKEYQLSAYSEEYNTHYFFCLNNNSLLHCEEYIFIDKSLPSAFVVEIASLKDGEKTILLYNDSIELPIAKAQGKYSINNNVASNYIFGEKKLSLYFINSKLVFYIDEKRTAELPFVYDHHKKIGVRLKKDFNPCRFFYCYEPVPFLTANYGTFFELGDTRKTEGIRAVPHNVGKPHCLTFPTDVTCGSARSIRFEYRLDDVNAKGINSMRRARSEISGVFCHSPMNKWIIEYDFYVPIDTQDDDGFEIITQIHEGSKTPVAPSFCIWMENGLMGCTVKGDSCLLENPNIQGNVVHHYAAGMLKVQKGKWHHIKIYVKEGYQYSSLPLTKVWIDSKLMLELHAPNCYNYEPTKADYYSYLKFGIYKPGWISNSGRGYKTSKRVYYFDNMVVKY